MSHINQALSELSQKEQGANVKIEKAQVEKVKSRPVLAWLIGGFSLSLAIGGWAVSQQSAVVEQTILPKPLVISDVETSTDKALTDEITINVAEKEAELKTTSDSIQQVTIYPSYPSLSRSDENDTASAKSKVTPQPKVNTVKVNQSETVVPATTLASSKKVEPKLTNSNTALSSSSTILLANSAKSSELKPTTESNVRVASSNSTSNTVIIEQVELTPKQLAQKAEQRARKAIDSNNIDEALSSYREALRYDPTDESVRQQLAALYYGKGDPRRAFEVLQEGIKIDNDSEVLRVALAKLLIKEQQPEAALTPLMHLSHTPTVEYLSLRAALAQKNDLDDIALETYQQLVNVDESNARWWLGLAIQQERNADMSSASAAYEKALTKVGLSRQSQIFVRERLKLLSTLEPNTTNIDNTASEENNLAN
ncbi:tetratricopeptide repeat protein [uncultured Vibrio sp.]|uniref:tetratricopeptide repeat protein n=1 Tax=uncultured Vibrio sp. TaxID=114054 RepID=UPI000921A3D8|nr:tetratricopeptide repeat protein [uncultured Vibrio sp.]OIQ24846.1 MAG: hypothetical protein BM561_08135 [Vibrio sp. MedPE-SWchi]